MDAHALVDSDRPFFLGAPLTYTRVNILVCMSIGKPAGMDNEDCNWHAIIPCSAFSSCLEADGIYILGARLSEVMMSGVSDQLPFYVTITNADGVPFPFHTPHLYVASTAGSTYRGSCKTVSTHFAIDTQTTKTDVVSVPRALRSPIALARADAYLTGIRLMRIGHAFGTSDTASDPKGTTVNVHREANTFIDTPALRHCAVPPTSAPRLPLPSRLFGRDIPTDWFTFATTYFPPQPNSSVPDRTMSGHLWDAIELAAERTLGFQTTQDQPQRAHLPPLVDIRGHDATAIRVCLSEDTFVRQATGPARLVTFHLQLFLAAFYRHGAMRH